MVFDFTKYGFKFCHEHYNIKTWQLKTDGNSFVNLDELDGVITIENISVGFEEYPQMICNRYECKDYKDVEFLLFKGRIGHLFKYQPQ